MLQDIVYAPLGEKKKDQNAGNANIISCQTKVAPEISVNQSINHQQTVNSYRHPPRPTMPARPTVLAASTAFLFPRVPS
jgi:hypothetical protein